MRIGIGLLALSAVVGCGDDGNMLPVGGGGGDGGFTFPDSNGGGGGDGGGDGGGTDSQVAAIDANIFTGRVCLAADPRRLNECSTTGAGGLTVRLGSASTTTAADGTFMIEGQASNVWRVTGANIVSSYMLLGDYEIPAITRTTYDAMIAANMNGLTLNPGEGSVMAQVIQNGVGRTGAFASSAPTSTWQPFYDGTSQTDWDQDATDVNGTIWFAGLDVGTASITVTYIDDFAKGGLPIFDGGITFTTVIIP
jgi:hypothetical protein